MKVKRVIVDEMPSGSKGCFDCNGFESDGEGMRACNYMNMHIDNPFLFPLWCPLELEMDGWIPMSERSPDYFEVVLVCWGVKTNFIQSARFIGKDGFVDDCGDSLTIKYWQPLPEPPESHGT